MVKINSKLGKQLYIILLTVMFFDSLFFVFFNAIQAYDWHSIGVEFDVNTNIEVVLCLINSLVCLILFIGVIYLIKDFRKETRNSKEEKSTAKIYRCVFCEKYISKEENQIDKDSEVCKEDPYAGLCWECMCKENGVNGHEWDD